MAVSSDCWILRTVSRTWLAAHGLASSVNGENANACFMRSLSVKPVWTMIGMEPQFFLISFSVAGPSRLAILKSKRTISGTCRCISCKPANCASINRVQVKTSRLSPRLPEDDFCRELPSICHWSHGRPDIENRGTSLLRALPVLVSCLAPTQLFSRAECLGLWRTGYCNKFDVWHCP